MRQSARSTTSSSRSDRGNSGGKGGSGPPFRVSGQNRQHRAGGERQKGQHHAGDARPHRAAEAKRPGMQGPPHDQRRARQVQRDRAGAGQLGQKQHHDAEGRIFGEVAMRADPQREVILAAVADRDAMRLARIHHMQRQENIKRNERQRIAGSDHRRLPM
ncbi:hypothetical protein SDC9_16860 [bioreactor metagenome]|uniref:Uncharacterized protein n=1 Tax=bioreactor metagenome TaxID=1076179 RepID=A0A644TY08_9ZZZZ